MAIRCYAKGSNGKYALLKYSEFSSSDSYISVIPVVKSSNGNYWLPGSDNPTNGTISIRLDGPNLHIWNHLLSSASGSKVYAVRNNSYTGWDVYANGVYLGFRENRAAGVGGSANVLWADAIFLTRPDDKKATLSTGIILDAYQCSIDTDIEGCSISGIVGNNFIPASTFNSSNVLFLGGETASFSATLSNDYADIYRVKRWLFIQSGVSSVASTSTDSSVSLSLPISGDVKVSVELERYRYRLTVKSVNVLYGSVSQTFESSLVSLNDTLGSITATSNKGFRFIGWYRGYGDNLSPDECLEFVSSDTSFVPSVVDSDVTYVAKFIDVHTTIDISINGDGVFDVSLEGELVLSDATSYVNEECEYGQQLEITAKSSHSYYFSHWELPDGSISNENTLSVSLFEQSINRFIAHFVEKSQIKLISSFIGGGIIRLVDVTEEASDDIVSSETISLLNETIYALSGLCDESRFSSLYQFSGWEYSEDSGGTWKTLTSKDKPSWCHAVFSNGTIELFVGRDDVHTDVYLRAVFSIDSTSWFRICEYTIDPQAALLDGCAGNIETDSVSVSSVEGVLYWKNGTNITVRSLPSSRWDATYISINDNIHRGVQSYSFVLSCDIDSIVLSFNYKKVDISISIVEGATSFSQASFEFINEKGETVVINDGGSECVPIGTELTLNSRITSSAYDGRVKFFDWTINGETLSTSQSGVRIIVSDSLNIVARYSAQHTFSIFGKESGDLSRWFGRISVSYYDGNTTSIIDLPFKNITDDDISSFSIFLLCGSRFSLNAIAEVYEGMNCFFAGWTVDGKKKSDWGRDVSDIPVSVPIDIVGRFTNQEIWPILRLRNEGDIRLCNFYVSGVRSERSQVVNGVVKELTNANDYFCDAFSRVKVVIEELGIIGNRKFSHWRRMSFGSLEVEGSDVVDELFSTSKALEVVVSEDICLVPIFQSIEPVKVRVGFVTHYGNGDVYIEGDSSLLTEATVSPGDRVSIIASPRNGWRFDGWYSNAQGNGDPISLDSKYIFNVYNDMSLYGKFVVDSSSIWTFGTGETTKTLHWRSRRVSVAQPVSWTCAQVDVEGSYDGVELVLGHGSSPELPLREDRYRVIDGNSRRLMVSGRPEKFLEVEVVSSEPVNFIAVSTSVSGLLGGGSE